MERLISGCIPSCSPWFQLRWVASLFHWERWLKDVSVCELVRRHTSITVSLHWLNVPLMRGRQMRLEMGGGGWKESYEGQKERKAKSFDSRKLAAKPIPTDSHQWILMVEGKDGEWEHLCVGGWVYVHVSVHVWIRLHVGAKNNGARQQYGVSVGCFQLIIGSECSVCKTWFVSRFRYERNPPRRYIRPRAPSLSYSFN